MKLTCYCRTQNEFTSLLLPPLASRLRHHLPQLLSMPPVLAHTVYQVVHFDQQLRSRGYRPRTWPTVLRPDEVPPEEDDAEWEGLSETILGRDEWFDRWLDGERECESAFPTTAAGHPLEGRSETPGVSFPPAPMPRCLLIPYCPLISLRRALLRLHRDGRCVAHCLGGGH